MLSKSRSARAGLPQLGMGRRSNISSARSRNLRIQAGSFFIAEISSTTSRLRPRFALKTGVLSSWKPYWYSVDSARCATIVRPLSAHGRRRDRRRPLSYASRRGVLSAPGTPLACCGGAPRATVLDLELWLVVFSSDQIVDCHDQRCAVKCLPRPAVLPRHECLVQVVVQHHAALQHVADHR